ncbi:MAG: hypothetical protein OXF79_24765 [Chloroflexi bacterium]|nr:hypothetical protein [Chloroflexota bacterium]
MTDSKTDGDSAEVDPGTRHGIARTSRTIRFSDREWEQVSQAAARHDIASPAEFVRNAAMTMAKDDSLMTRSTLSPGLVQLIEHTFRGVLFLSTLKRDELIRQGREDDVESVLQAGREAQSELLSDD